MDSDVVKFFGVMASLGVVGALTYGAIVVINALASRLKGGQRGVSSEEMEYLRDRADQVDALADRVAELETRLDFAERVLTRPEDQRHDTPVGSG